MQTPGTKTQHPHPHASAWIKTESIRSCSQEWMGAENPGSATHEPLNRNRPALSALETRLGDPVTHRIDSPWLLCPEGRTLLLASGWEQLVLVQVNPFLHMPPVPPLQLVQHRRLGLSGCSGAVRVPQAGTLRGCRPGWGSPCAVPAKHRLSAAFLPRQRSPPWLRCIYSPGNV